MAPNRKLILLTQKYPFEYGEDFVENELLFLSKAYDEIFLIPTLARDYASRRPVPSNISIIAFVNPEGPLTIFEEFVLNLRRSAKMFFREIQEHKPSLYICKYLIYHIPLAFKIKDKIQEIIGGKEDFDFYSYWMDTNAYALHLLAKEKPGIPFFFRTHGGDLYNDRHPHGQIPFRKAIYQSASLIAPVSRYGKTYIGKNWPEINHKVKTHYLGVLHQGINPHRNVGEIRIVSCSAIIPLKRLDKIIAVLSQLRENIEWNHFGGKEGDIEKTKRLAEEKMPPNVSCNFRGQVSHGELMEFYMKRPCDIFINLSSSEGIPVSIMEAISFGIPVISNDVGGVGEIVNEQTGLLVHVDESASSIGEKISGILENGLTKDEAFRKNVRKFWEANFDAEINYPLFIREIQQTYLGQTDSLRSHLTK